MAEVVIWKKKKARDRQLVKSSTVVSVEGLYSCWTEGRTSNQGSDFLFPQRTEDQG